MLEMLPILGGAAAGNAHVVRALSAWFRGVIVATKESLKRRDQDMTRKLALGLFKTVRPPKKMKKRARKRGIAEGLFSTPNQKGVW